MFDNLYTHMDQQWQKPPHKLLVGLMMHQGVEGGGGVWRRGVEEG